MTISLQSEDAKESNQLIILKKTQASMDRLTSDIDRILKSSQLASGQVVMQQETMNLKELILELIKNLDPLAKERQVSIVTNLETTVAYVGDSYWISQALLNIMKNAVEHTNMNGKIFVCLKEKGTTVKLRIEDEGTGISAEELPHLFERFHRGSFTKAGYGIGLNMAYDIIKAHHGTLSAGNRMEKGAWFLAEFPILEGSRTYQ